MIYLKKRESNKIVDYSNYLKVTHYDSTKKVYSSEYVDYINEVKQLSLNTIDYWDELSSSCQNHINDLFFLKYKVDYNNTYTYYFENEKSGEYSYIEKKLDRIKEFALKYDMDVFESDNSINIDYLSSVYSCNRIINEDKVKLDVMVYAISEKQYQLLDFDEFDNLILSDDAVELYITNKNLIPLTTKEKMRKSISQSYNAFKSYSFSNVDKFNYFVTLTFAEVNEKDKHLKLNEYRRINDESLLFDYIENPKDYEACVKSLSKFLNKLKVYMKKIKGMPLYYLGVPEYQKNGNIHYHFLMSELPDNLIKNNPSWVDRDYNTNKIRNSKFLKTWTYGISDIQIIKNRSRISTYISKYMLKSLQEIDETDFLNRLNKKRFYNSNNLEKPKKTYGYFSEQNINFLSKHDTYRVNAFDNSKIVESIYQIKEL